MYIWQNSAYPLFCNNTRIIRSPANSSRYRQPLRRGSSRVEATLADTKWTRAGPVETPTANPGIVTLLPIPKLARFVKYGVVLLDGFYRLCDWVRLEPHRCLKRCMSRAELPRRGQHFFELNARWVLDVALVGYQEEPSAHLAVILAFQYLIVYY